MRIGDAAAAAGTTPRALRFYEERGLLPPPSRSATGQRQYGPRDVARVRVIRVLLSQGLTVEDVHSCADRLDLLLEDPQRRCGTFGDVGGGDVGGADGGGADVRGADGCGADRGGAGVVERRLAVLDAEIARLTRLREQLAARAVHKEPRSPDARGHQLDGGAAGGLPSIRV